ncbi:MAG TPA: hypothetical protein VGK01_06210 [Candidatus Angelobacter sp.]|jgi:hypothetical protein
MPKSGCSPGYLPEAAYQARAKAALDRLYQEVAVQWYPFRGEGRDMYAPRVDIAVGPFAIERRYIDEYTDLMRATRSFIENLIEQHNHNARGIGQPLEFDDVLHFNDNARCLIAIEIEEWGGRKHCLGNLVNASSLGRIGILVARTPTVLRTFLRQRTFFQFLEDVGKNTFKTANALVLSEAQFDECLQRIPERLQGNGQEDWLRPRHEDLAESPPDDPIVFHVRPLPRSRRTGRR